MRHIQSHPLPAVGSASSRMYTVWAVAAHWAFTGSHSFLRASSQLQDTQCSWPRTRVAYTWHRVHRAERQGPHAEWGEGLSREPVPAPDVTQTPRGSTSSFLPGPPFALCAWACCEGRKDREGGSKGVETAKSPWAPTSRKKSSRRKECIWFRNHPPGIWEHLPWEDAPGVWWGQWHFTGGAGKGRGSDVSWEQSSLSQPDLLAI